MIKTQINCARVYRKEVHRPHEFVFQYDDDSPDTVIGLCFGYSDGSWYINFVPF